MLTSCFLINEKCNQLFSALTKTCPDTEDYSFCTMKLLKGAGPGECPRRPLSPAWKPEQTAQTAGHRADPGSPGRQARVALAAVPAHTTYSTSPASRGKGASGPEATS